MTTTGATTEPVTQRRVLRIALPIVLSNATVPLLGAVDTGVIGQLGTAAPIAAVGMGAVILATCYWVFGFLRMGTSGLAAQARGAGDQAELGAILARGLMIGLAAGVILVALQTPLVAAAFRLAPAEAGVETLGRTYLAIRIWGAPATIALYAITGWLIAVERTRAVLVMQLWMNGLNVVLDLVFVLRLGWGVEGVAVASLVAEWTGLGLGLWLCRAGLTAGHLPSLARILDRERLGRMAVVNTDIMIRSVILQGAFTTFVFVGAGFGEVTQAANQVLMQFLEITAFALDGFAFAAEALVGQAVGARALGDFRRAVVISSQWAAGGALVLGLVFWFAGPAIIDLMATDPAVRAAAREWLVWVSVAPVIGVACWMLDGIFIGATRTRDMRNAMIQTLVLYVPLMAVLAMLAGNTGLWIALNLMFVIRAVTLWRYYPGILRDVAR